MQVKESYWRVSCPVPQESGRGVNLRTLNLAGFLLDNGQAFFAYDNGDVFTRREPYPLAISLGQYAIYAALNAEDEDEEGVVAAKLDYYGIYGYGTLLAQGRPFASASAAQQVMTDRFQQDLTEALPAARPVPTRRAGTRTDPAFLWSRFQASVSLREGEVRATEISGLAGMLTTEGEFTPLVDGALVVEVPPLRARVPVEYPFVLGIEPQLWTPLRQDEQHLGRGGWSRDPLAALLQAEESAQQSLANYLYRLQQVCRTRPRT